MKKILFIFSMLLAIGLTSACGSDDDASNIPEGWSKGPDGSFVLKIANEDFDNLGNGMLEAYIETAPVDMESTEKSLLCQGRKVQFNATDIPMNDRNIGNTFCAKITAYYQVPYPYWNIIIICQVKKTN